MSTILTTIDQLKDKVGGAVNPSLEFEAIRPYIEDVQRDHIMPLIGPDFLNDLITNQDTATGKQLELVNKIRKAVGYLCVYKYVNVGSVQLGEAGLFRTESESHKSTYKYQEQNYRDQMRESGYEALEEVIIFLQLNKINLGSLYTLEYYQKTRSMFINLALEFRNVYSSYISRYTYESLKPLMEDLETFAILPIIGQELFDRLKLSIADNDLTPVEILLVRHIQKALAHFTIEEGVRRLWVKIEGINVVQTERLEPQGLERQGSAGNLPLSVNVRHLYEFGNRWISYIKKYLLDNIEDFEEYADFIAEQEAAELEEEEAILECGCLNICECDKGIIFL